MRRVPGYSIINGPHGMFFRTDTIITINVPHPVLNCALCAYISVQPSLGIALLSSYCSHKIEQEKELFLSMKKDCCYQSKEQKQQNAGGKGRFSPIVHSKSLLISAAIILAIIALIDRLLICRSKLKTFVFQHLKGQLILECNFGVFKSQKKPTKFFTDFCPSFIGQKSV